MRAPEKKKGGTGVSPIEFTVTRARDKHCGIFDENDNARKTTFPKNDNSPKFKRRKPDENGSNVGKEGIRICKRRILKWR